MNNNDIHHHKNISKAKYFFLFHVKDKTKQKKTKNKYVVDDLTRSTFCD